MKNKLAAKLALLVATLTIGLGTTCKGMEASEYDDIFQAIINGDLEAVEQFIADGVDVNAPDIGQRPPLHTAIWSGRNQNIINRLLSVQGIDVNAINGSGQTPLHLTANPLAGCNRVATAQALLSLNSINVNILDYSNRSALHEAVFNNQTAIVALLLQHPTINVNTIDITGSTPLDATAQMIGYHHLAAILQQHGAVHGPNFQTQTFASMEP